MNTFFFIIGIVGTKEYRKPEWVTQMEEMQEALRGKNDKHQNNSSSCVRMPAFLSDYSNNVIIHQTKETLFDSSITMIQTVMNLEDTFNMKTDVDIQQTSEIQKLFNAFENDNTHKKIFPFTQNIDKINCKYKILKNIKNISKSKQLQYKIKKNNTKFKQYSRNSSDSSKLELLKKRRPVITTTKIKCILNNLNLRQQKQYKLSSYVKLNHINLNKPIHKRNLLNIDKYSKRNTKKKNEWKYMDDNTSIFPYFKINKQKERFALDFEEIPPTKYEKNLNVTFKSSHSTNQSFFSSKDAQSNFYLSPIEEASETSTSSTSQSKQLLYCNNTNYQNDISAISFDNTFEKYALKRKYHTYPKSRIPISRKFHGNNKELKSLIEPKIYSLEPREIELEYFQQLHTADSQEELQEFLLLESQCSGDLSLTNNIINQEIYQKADIEEDQGTMSGIFCY